MSNIDSLDLRINKTIFWATLAVIVVAIAGSSLPLDAPLGTVQERVAWLHANLHEFRLAWALQMIAMLSLSLMFAGATWQIRATHPLSAMISAIALFGATMAFTIVKFVAFWSVPQMAEVASAGSAGADIALQLVTQWNVATPFGLFSSLDYLGFWLYGVSGLFIACPLWRLSMPAKVAAVGFVAYGLLYQIMLLGLLAGVIAQADIGSYFDSIPGLLLLTVFGMLFHTRPGRSA